MNTKSLPLNVLSHERIDSLVASIFGLFARPAAIVSHDEVAFSDEWERKQIDRELHGN